MEWWVILLLVIAVLVTIILLTPVLIGAIYRSNTRMAPSVRMDGKTIIVTGASSGIGRESTLIFARMGARVIMACRNLKKAQPIADDIISKTGNQNVVLKQLDVSDLSSVRKFATEINEEEPQIHVLYNNAGVSPAERKLSKDGFELTMATNHYGPFLLSVLLAGKLKASAPSRVVTVSSIAQRMDILDVDDMNFEKRTNNGLLDMYAQSKLCNVLFTKEFSRRMEGTGVASYSVDPGSFVSDIMEGMDGHIFSRIMTPLSKVVFRTTVQGAQTSVFLCTSDKIDGKSGDHFLNCRKQTVKNKAADMDLAKKLWEVSAKDVKLTEAEAAATLGHS